jgi:hypothetical protein
MRNIAVGFTLALLALLVATHAQAASPNVTERKAATATMPAALQALQAQSQVVAQGQAERVRGQWWITLPLSTGIVHYQGFGAPFAVNVQTVGVNYPTVPTGIRVTIGR